MMRNPACLMETWKRTAAQPKKEMKNERVVEQIRSGVISRMCGDLFGEPPKSPSEDLPPPSSSSSPPQDELREEGGLLPSHFSGAHLATWQIVSRSGDGGRYGKMLRGWEEPRGHWEGGEGPTRPGHPIAGHCPM